MPGPNIAPDPFHWFDSLPEVMRLVGDALRPVPVVVGDVEDFAHKRGINICHGTVRNCGELPLSIRGAPKAAPSLLHYPGYRSYGCETEAKSQPLLKATNSTCWFDVLST